MHFLYIDSALDDAGPCKWKNTIPPNGVLRVALDAPPLLLLTLSLRSVPPVRKDQEHRDAF